MSRSTRTGAAIVIAVALLILLTACGGGGSDDVPAGQCYTAGQPTACPPPSATVLPVDCAASGACS